MLQNRRPTSATRVPVRLAFVPIRIDPRGDTVCDALRSRQIGVRAFEILQRSNVQVCAVSDELVQHAARLLLGTCGIRVEPSGALAMAAVLGGVVDSERSRIWVIACGGNVPSLARERL
ncbi:pyridoxal-phosphate dependent enzyme [Bradyrhizobium sp. JR3.5]